jgi:hypothetical protein
MKTFLLCNLFFKSPVSAIEAIAMLNISLDISGSLISLERLQFAETLLNSLEPVTALLISSP